MSANRVPAENLATPLFHLLIAGMFGTLFLIVTAILITTGESMVEVGITAALTIGAGVVMYRIVKKFIA